MLPRSRAGVGLCSFLLLASLAACGDGSGDVSTPPDPSTTIPGSDASSPYVVVSSSEISGQSGKLLLVSVVSADGGQLGVSCIAIDQDSFVLPPTPIREVPGGDNPCAGGTAPREFEDGSYELIAGVYVPGSQQADPEFQITIIVTGGLEYELLGAMLSR